jgi:hypothetical protein
MAFKVPASLASSGGLSVEGDVEIDAFSNVARISATADIPMTVRKNSAGADFTRNRLNLIEGTNVTITITDDATDDEIDITIDSTGGGGGLTPIADDTFLANISGGPATPTAVALTTLAGDGLTGGANAVLAVGASTSIIVNTNDIQRAALVGDITATQNVNTTAFRAFAAKSVLANATNSSAVPSDLAGSAAFQHLRVNSANSALEWATLSGYASTSIVYASNTFERAALTGAIASSQNSNATLFSGIRVNGSATTDRTNINFIAGTGVTITPTDDAGSDEIEITIVATGTGLSAIADQRVLGNDSGSSATPTATTVHQVLDWLAGAGGWIFDGVNDHVNFGNVLVFERTDSHTYSFWFQTTQTVSGYIFNKQNLAASRHGPAVFIDGSTGQIFMNFNNNSGGANDMEVRTDLGYNDGNLHHCLISYGGTGATSVNFYIDGSLVAKTVIENLLSTTLITTSDLLIGWDGVGFAFEGILRDLAQWTVACSAGDAAAIFAAGIGADYTSLGLSANPVQLIRLDGLDTVVASGILDYGTGSNEGTAGGGFAPLSGADGSIPVRGATQWQLIQPTTAGLPLVCNGPGLVPTYEQLSLSALPAIAADSVLVNVTAAPAIPTAHSLATFAGAGLTYTGVTGILAVGSSTSITVNANDVQRSALTGAITAAVNSNTTAFGALAAKSVLANATNASAVPAALAGSAAFQYLRVNSANTALEWAVLSLASFPTMTAGSFLANVTAGTAVPTAHDLTTFAGAGLTYTNVTGIMAVGAGSGITVNANDVAITSGGVTPAMISVIASSVATTITIYASFAAGAGGAADDVSIFTSNAPFNFRITEVIVYTTTAVSLSTVTLRSATGGLGSALSSAISTTTTGQTSNNNTATTTVASASSLIIRRSDSGVAGEVVIFAVKT